MRLVLLGTALSAVVAVAAGSAPALRSQQPPPACEGLTICVPVGGPWVVVPAPARGSAGAQTAWELRCPNGVVGGLDARVADPWVAVSFAGRIGSPVNPGITTTDAVVFIAFSVGPDGRASSFIPFIGCIPSEGGARTPTGIAAAEQFRPGAPVVRRVRTLEVRARRIHAVHACKAGERLLSVETAVGLYTAIRPTRAQLQAVRVTRSVRHGRIFVGATRHGLPRDVDAQVQIHALCAQVAR